MKFDVELVGKVGSMALVDETGTDLDYNKFARLSRFLKPGVVWVSSGATVIGKLDYLKRHGVELDGTTDEVKADYAAQGQIILMDTYRMFIDAKYSVRQILLEHHHFNDEVNRQHIKNLIIRSANQNAVPIINYNDCVSAEENRKWEIIKLKSAGKQAVELVDNDETASQVACLVRAETLLLLTNLDGIYKNLNDKNSLIPEISGKNIAEVLQNIDAAKLNCNGASRAGANGAAAKLEYIKPCIEQGSRVIIANARYDVGDILTGKAPRTLIAAR